MAAHVDRFLERFLALGAQPSARTYLPLFHPDATVFVAAHNQATLRDRLLEWRSAY